MASRDHDAGGALWLRFYFRHPRTGEPYNPDFAAMARSAGIDGVNTLALPGDVAQWTLTTLREKLVKIGARIVGPVPAM